MKWKTPHEIYAWVIEQIVCEAESEPSSPKSQLTLELLQQLQEQGKISSNFPTSTYCRVPTSSPCVWRWPVVEKHGFR